ncbi:general substrate transporter [Dendrothele bispora CBS 962.96]|uniref:General substrate transporter n=1 Tax=Dendrothele bispora (strain CBS 962.96) TaxID=1314807 RepID=A0A4V4HGW7_DENBC|nr:general substrate transporter [Dendrothele bispora CBS 962.96]
MAGGAVANTGDSLGFQHLVDPRRKWHNNRRLIALHAWIVLILITASTNGYDGSMMNGLQSLPQWKGYFNNPSNSKLGLLNAIQNIGSLAAYPFAPYISDGIGRKKAIILGAFIMCAATAIQTAAQSVGMFIGARFLIGFGLTFASNAAPMLVTEISYPSYRAPLTSTYNSLWYSGAIVAAWTTFGTFKVQNTWAWRIPSALQGLPSVLQIFMVWFMPESPRWLVSKGREDEALEILAYYHADGNRWGSFTKFKISAKASRLLTADREDPLVRYEFEEIKASIDFDKNVAANVGWKALIQTPGNRKRMRIIVAIAFFSQWSGNGLASYYLNKILDDINITSATIQLLINAILATWNLFWALLASAMVNRFGRRLMFMTSCIGMLVFFIAQTISFSLFLQHGSPDAAHSVIAFLFLFYAAYDIAFTPLIVSYTVEILPFHLRAKGFNVFNFTISLALIFNQYVNPIALGKSAENSLGATTSCIVVGSALRPFSAIFVHVVETKGLTLEETAALFDGEDAAKHIAGEANTHAHAPIDEKTTDSAESIREHSMPTVQKV